MEDAKLQTKQITHLGACNLSPSELDCILKEAYEPIAVMQTEVHPYLPRTRVVTECQKRGIVVQAYSPLGSPGLNKSPVLLQDVVVNDIAKQHNATAAQVLLAYSIARGLQPIVKSVRTERITENLAALQLCLGYGDMQRLLSIGTRCRYVAPDWKSWETGDEE
eukprot:TRINITY_DN5409_c0_g1_i2.p1 TRINITY_DN5409_c0_g1~~TRINITY_DN5409_c0_g1_i2.p1  ORF type:complete len:164 (+),score=34.20 TRINITY_DN5409_c0_g1_i2:569-1060(+)